MSRFSENNSKYMTIMMILLCCLPYLALGLMVAHVDPVIQFFIWFLIIMAMAFFFTIAPLRQYKIHQGPCMNSLFQVGPVVYLNHTMREIVLGVKGDIEEMRFDWSDGNLLLLEQSTIYLNAKREVLAQESSLMKKDKSLTKRPEKMELLVEGLNIRPSDAPMEQIAKFISHMEDIEIENVRTKRLPSPKKEEEAITTIEDYKKFLTKPEPTEIVVQEASKHNDKIIVKPIFKDLSDLGMTTSEQKELLKNLYFYKVPLYHEEYLEGYEGVPFQKAIYVLPGPFHEVLSSSPLEVYDYADYKCDARGCSVIWVCLGFVRGKYPMFLLMGSENMAKIQDLEAIKSQKLKYSTIYYLRLKILEKLLDELTYEQDPFQNRINTYETQLQAHRERYNALLGEYMVDTMKVGNPIVENENKNLQIKLAGYKKWKWIAIGGLIIIGVLILILVGVTFMGGMNVAPPPST